MVRSDNAPPVTFKHNTQGFLLQFRLSRPAPSLDRTRPELQMRAVIVVS